MFSFMSKSSHPGHSKKKPARNLAAPQINHDHGHNSTIYAISVDGKSYPLNSDNQVVDHRNHKFLDIEDLSAMVFDKYVGPTPESNWVIPGRLLVGAYPASRDDNETYQLLTSILKYGVTKFVCLQQEYRSNGVTEDMWRNGQGLRPYFEDIKIIVKDPDGFELVAEEGCRLAPSVSFVHFPIKDCGITDDDRVIDLSRSLVKALAQGDIIYLHCWGGHGRTGTIVSIMLHLMYNLTAKDAMARCQRAHDMREYPVDVGSPQTQQQRDQVIRVIKKISASNAFPASTVAITTSHNNTVKDESSHEEKLSADVMEGFSKSDDSEDQDNMTESDLVADILGDQMAEIDVDDAASMDENDADIVSIDLPQMDIDNDTDENKPAVQNAVALSGSAATVENESMKRSIALPRLKTTSRLSASKNPKHSKEQAHRPISPIKTSMQLSSSLRNRSTSQSSRLSKDQDPQSPIQKFTSGSPRPKETWMTRKANLSSSKDGSRKASLSTIKEVQESKLQPLNSETPATGDGTRNSRQSDLQSSLGFKSSSTVSRGNKNDASRSVSPQASSSYRSRP